MSTRTNVGFRGKGCYTILYRHCDGYPAECGGAILRAVAGAKGKGDASNVAYMATALLALRYDPTSYDPQPRPIYELTDSIHGDIEHLYEVRIKDDESAEIGHAAWNWEQDDSRADLETVLRSKMQWHTPAEFAQVVNNDRRGINYRGEQWAKKNGTEFEAMPMVDAEGKDIVPALALTA